MTYLYTHILWAQWLLHLSHTSKHNIIKNNKFHANVVIVLILLISFYYKCLVGINEFIHGLAQTQHAFAYIIIYNTHITYMVLLLKYNVYKCDVRLEYF